MAFRKKTVDFLQKERDELPTRRPVIIYLVCPVLARDFQQRTQLYSQFQKAQGLPDGVFTRENNPYNSCLVEANRDTTRFEEQLEATLDKYKEASYKVLVVNGHGCPNGVLLNKGEEEDTVVLTGGMLAMLASRHYHDCHFHTICLTAYGHKLADAFISAIVAAYGDRKELRKLFAITYFTSEEVPEAWQRPATAGEAHIELKRDITEFLSKHVQSNSPYKILDSQIDKTASCLLL